MQKRWASVHEASRGPFYLRLGAGLRDVTSSALRSLSGLQQLNFKTRHAWPTRSSGLGPISNCRRCKSTGCLATIDP